MQVIIVTSNGVEKVTKENAGIVNSLALPVDYSKKSLAELAYLIRTDWRKTSAKGVHPYAKPYLEAMECLNSITDNYGADTGYSIVAYLLANLSQYKGETAKAIKAELKKRLKNA